MYTAEEYKTYLKVKHALLLEDAKNYVADYFDDLDDATSMELDSSDYENLVTYFEERFDHFDPFAEVWQNIVIDYFDEM